MDESTAEILIAELVRVQIVITTEFARLGRKIDKLTRAIESDEEMDAATMDRLVRVVERNSNTIDSAVTLISQMAQQLRDTAANVPQTPETAEAVQKINTLADQLESKAQVLAEAIVANTPAQQAGGTSGAQQPV